jgi:hypothetical protein
MIETQAKKVGINLKSVAMAFGEIVNRLDQKNFQMYILGWRIGGSDPGYLYNFFHCSQGAGQNYPGYCNATFDKMMDEYRAIFDKPKRIQLIKDAQGILVDDLPYNVLYYRTNIEATRKDTFTGWVQGTSGIYTGWSLLLIDSPKTPMLTNFVDNRDKIVSGDSMDITVKVTEKATGNPIADADIQLKIESGTDAGQLGVKSGYPGQSDGVTLTGKTDSAGIFKGVFNATAGLTTDKSVSLSATALKEGYTQENTATWEITVLKMGSKGISIDQYAFDPDTIMAGETSRITVRVVDLQGIPVSGATVDFETTLGTVNPSNTTTDANGKATATYTVPKEASITGDGVKVDIVAKAHAVLGGVPVSTSMSKSITVTPYKEPPKQGIPFIDSAVVVIVLLAAAAVSSIILARKKR